jgi:hypothetical protein
MSYSTSSYSSKCMTCKFIGGLGESRVQNNPSTNIPCSYLTDLWSDTDKVSVIALRGTSYFDKTTALPLRQLE